MLFNFVIYANVRISTYETVSAPALLWMTVYVYLFDIIYRRPVFKQKAICEWDIETESESEGDDGPRAMPEITLGIF